MADRGLKRCAETPGQENIRSRIGQRRPSSCSGSTEPRRDLATTVKLPAIDVCRRSLAAALFACDSVSAVSASRICGTNNNFAAEA